MPRFRCAECPQLGCRLMQHVTCYMPALPGPFSALLCCLGCCGCTSRFGQPRLGQMPTSQPRAPPPPPATTTHPMRTTQGARRQRCREPGAAKHTGAAAHGAGLPHGAGAWVLSACLVVIGASDVYVCAHASVPTAGACGRRLLDTPPPRPARTAACRGCADAPASCWSWVAPTWTRGCGATSQKYDCSSAGEVLTVSGFVAVRLGCAPVRVSCLPAGDRSRRAMHARRLRGPPSPAPHCHPTHPNPPTDINPHRRHLQS